MRSFLLPLLLLICNLAQAATLPIIFVHGNGDDSTKWVPTIWLFESNGYPNDRLYSIRFSNPSARANDAKFEPNRSSSIDAAAELSAMVTRVLLETGEKKVALVGSSRGGLTIRNYLKNAGGAAHVSHAILCGTPNHGVMIMPPTINNEFNANGPFLTKLNQGSESIDGVRFQTIRSDKNDKYAQPGVGFEGPELKGAENIILPGLDHREVAFHRLAFAEMYRFLTNNKPQTLEPTPLPQSTISGLVTGFANNAATNLPLANAKLNVYALDPQTKQRKPGPLLTTTTDQTGTWGPLTVDPATPLEFEMEAENRTVRIFRSPMPRSTNILNLRFYPAAAARNANLVAARPQGYWSKGRDPLTLDGSPVEEILAGLPTNDSVPLKITPEKSSGLALTLRTETIIARPATTPTETHIAEFWWD